jgi:hypothetical protein
MAIGYLVSEAAAEVETVIPLLERLASHQRPFEIFQTATILLLKTVISVAG